MKSIQLTFLFAALTISAYGQEYVFDTLVKSEFSAGSFEGQEMMDLFNSNDFSYHMQVFGRNDSLLSRVFDTEKNEVHYFNCDPSDFMKMEFLWTRNLTSIAADDTYSFSDVAIKQGVGIVDFTILNDRHKKVENYELLIKEADRDLFSIFRLSALETRLSFHVVPPINCVVLEAKGTNEQGKKINYALQSIEDIDLSIRVKR